MFLIHLEVLASVHNGGLSARFHNHIGYYIQYQNNLPAAIYIFLKFGPIIFSNKSEKLDQKILYEVNLT